MTTTELIQLLNSSEYACAEGLAFAAKHPNPYEAIDAAITGALDIPPSEFGVRGSGVDDPGQFLRWAASDHAVLGMTAYFRLRDELWPLEKGCYSDVRAFNAACVNALREWVRAQEQAQK